MPLRAGIHSGPCMAVVVGRTDPKYTLLGDTVNVASRMESTGTPGRVQCSERTADLIKQQASARSQPINCALPHWHLSSPADLANPTFKHSVRGGHSAVGFAGLSGGVGPL